MHGIGNIRPKTGEEDLENNYHDGCNMILGDTGQNDGIIIPSSLLRQHLYFVIKFKFKISIAFSLPACLRRFHGKV